MLNFAIVAPRPLLKRSNIAATCACVSALIVSMPPVLAGEDKDMPAATQEAPSASPNAQATNRESSAATQEAPATSQNPQTTGQASPPAGQQTPADTQESPPVKQDSAAAHRESTPSAGGPTASAGGVPGAGKASTQPLEPRRFHRAQMRLSGSTCLACLMALERKLKEFPGIAKVKIERADQTHFEFQGAPGINYSEGVITYDSGQVALSEIVAFMKTQGYLAYKIVEKDKR